MEYGFFIIITLAVIYLAWKAFQLARRNQGINIYDTVAPYAKNLKIVLQMSIGFGLAWLIVLKLLTSLKFGFVQTYFQLCLGWLPM